VLGYPALKRWAKLGRPYGTRRGARKRLRPTAKPNSKAKQQSQTAKPNSKAKQQSQTAEPNSKAKHMIKTSKPKKWKAEAYSQSLTPDVDKKKSDSRPIKHKN